MLTLDTPPRISAETGMNALAHGVEAAYSPQRTPEAEALALACIATLAAHLPEVVDEPGDLRARTDVLTGAVLGARCLQNATMGVHHGVAQLLGGRTGMAHGLANAVMLAHALRWNAPAIGDAAWRIGHALGDADDPAGAIDRLRERLGLPGTLEECGVSDDDVDAVVRLSGASGPVKANVRPMSEDDVRALLEAAR